MSLERFCRYRRPHQVERRGTVLCHKQRSQTDYQKIDDGDFLFSPQPIRRRSMSRSHTPQTPLLTLSLKNNFPSKVCGGVQVFLAQAAPVCLLGALGEPALATTTCRQSVGFTVYPESKTQVRFHNTTLTQVTSLRDAPTLGTGKENYFLECTRSFLAAQTSPGTSCTGIKMLQYDCIQFLRHELCICLKQGRADLTRLVLPPQLQISGCAVEATLLLSPSGTCTL